MSQDGLRPVRKRRQADVNIVPLIDVLVVLIFFFLFSTQFRNFTMLQLTLPQIETAAEAQASQYVEIGISRDGDIYYNGEKVDSEELNVRLALVARVDPTKPIVISADEGSLLKDTTNVMDICRKNGLESLQLHAR